MTVRRQTQDEMDPELLRLPPPLSLSRPPMRPASTDGVAAIVDGVPIPEHANCTHALVGATFASASCFHFEGKATLLFAFPVRRTTRQGFYMAHN